MGKATIISDDGEGLYTVMIRHDLSLAQALSAARQDSLASVGEAITDEEAKSPEEQDEIRLRVLEVRKAALEREIARLNSIEAADYQAQIYCADYTEELSGDVGTIEPATETKNGINIQPGFEGNAVFNNVRDGILTPFSSLPVADAMRNFAIAPGIQKWRPTFRYGSISNVDYDNDECSVDIDPAVSTIGGLNVNLKTHFDNVKIEYMNCDAAAFEDGDDVIMIWDPYDVESDPKVIGFQSNPKSCGVSIKVNSINGISSFNTWGVMLTQPVTIGAPAYEILSGPSALDSAHVKEMEILPGKKIDPDKPLHVWLCDMVTTTSERRLLYFAPDTSGSPQWGVKKLVDADEYSTTSFFWDYDPTDPPEEYEYLLNEVPGHRLETNLLTQSKTEFQDANGKTLKGYEVAFSGVLGVKWEWYRLTEQTIPDTIVDDEYDKELSDWTVYVEEMDFNTPFAYPDPVALVFERFEIDQVYWGQTQFACTKTVSSCVTDATCQKYYFTNDAYAWGDCRHRVTHDRTINDVGVIASIDGVPEYEDDDTLTSYDFLETMGWACKNIVVASEPDCGNPEDYFNGEEGDTPFCDGYVNSPLTCTGWVTTSEAQMRYFAAALDATKL